MAPLETEYYDLLGVGQEFTESELRKNYKKQALKWHPDKNRTPEAAEKFHELTTAYQVLTDPNSRAEYDKYGKAMAGKEGAGVGMDDAAGFFANVFGGERFRDWIGEISLMKEMTSVATAMLSEEEKAEMEKEINGGAKASSPTPDGPSIPSVIHHEDEKQESSAFPQPNSSSSGNLSPIPEATSGFSVSMVSHTGSESNKESTTSTNSPKNHHLSSKDKEFKKRSKMTAEQRAKLEELDTERRKAMETRISDLTQKLVERLRPFVEAKQPGNKDDPETVAFEARIKMEADDLKLESFGVELLHAIGTVYMMKGSSFMKSRKFLGIPGFWSRLKEKGALAKDAWGVIGSALGVQSMMQEMEKLQAKGELGEEELRALEIDVTGRIMLASWRGTRFEVVQVLREVCDNVLKDKSVDDVTLYNRAKGLIITGAIFKSTIPDESDEERRELERMVAEAATGKSKHQQMQAEARAAAKAKPREQSARGDKVPTEAAVPYL